MLFSFHLKFILVLSHPVNVSIVGNMKMICCNIDDCSATLVALHVNRHLTVLLQVKEHQQNKYIHVIRYCLHRTSSIRYSSKRFLNNYNVTFFNSSWVVRMSISFVWIPFQTKHAVKCFHSFRHDIFSDDMNKLLCCYILLCIDPKAISLSGRQVLNNNMWFDVKFFCSLSSCHSFYTAVIITVKYKVNTMFSKMNHHIIEKYIC